jgi:hypothetical protein
MAKDTITLKLSGGDVPIDLFSKAMGHLAQLVKDLSDEVAGPELVEWKIDGLNTGSAITRIKGYSHEPQDVEKVVIAYRNIGYAIKTGEEIPYSQTVAASAYAITSIINGDVTAVVFGTEGEETTITESWESSETDGKPGELWSYGIITGFAGTIWDRPKLRIAIYDDLFDKVVYCDLDRKYETQVRGWWQSRISVTGLIYRSPDDGRPVKIKNVVNVEVHNVEPVIKGFLNARGVLPWQEEDEPAEITIRRLRDGV